MFGKLSPVPALDRPDLLSAAVYAAVRDHVPDAQVFEIDPDHADTETLCRVYDLPMDVMANAVLVLGRRGGEERYCELGDIQIGDILLLKPGERIVADAVLTQGATSVDESPITGESRPIDKQVGSELASGTVNLQGSVEAEVLRPAGESTLAKLVRLMETAQTERSRTETVSERLESPYATIVLLTGDKK